MIEHGPRSRWPFVAAVIVVLLIGVFVGRLLPRDRDGLTEDAPRPSVPSATPERTESGAVQAATSFAELMASPPGAGRNYVAAVTEIAVQGWRVRASQIARNSVDFVAERYGRDGQLDFEPVRYRVRSFSEDSATVDVWGVVLASGSKIAGVEESWITGTIGVAWTEDGWKVDGQSSKGGPTPELLQGSEGSSIDQVLSDFHTYDDAED